MIDALYTEGIYTGYRYYYKAGVPVRWPFGYGLSYTSFDYANLNIKEKTVTVTVKNIGDRAGAEVVQLYIGAPQDGIHRPVRELKGFKKIFLQPGESTTVSFELEDRSYSIWQNGWKIPGGTYTIHIADLSESIKISGESIDIPAWQKESWYQSCKGKPTLKDWELLTGKTYTVPVLKKGKFTMNNTVMEMKDYSFVMRIMVKVVERIVAEVNGCKVDYDNPDFRMMINTSLGAPLRSMQIAGGVKDGIMQGLLDMANGHFFRGIGKMIKG